jgi:hypothetical protein
MRNQLNAFTASFSLHLIAAVMLLWVSAPAISRGEASAPSGRTIRVEWLSGVPRNLQSAPENGAGGDGLSLPETDSYELDIPGFSFDYEKIARRARSLFPFLTNPAALEPVLATLRAADGGGLVSPFATAAGPARKPPLTLADTAIQSIVDKAWTRRERWNQFQSIARFIEGYHPNVGSLPVLLERYADQDFLQPYADTTIRDPRLWTMLSIASEHSDFIEFIMGYAAAHPSTKTTTQLLFMLDDLAQGNRDTLLALMAIDPAKDLWWTGSVNRSAQDFIALIREYYRRHVELPRMTACDVIDAHYDGVRIGILTAILGATPKHYRESDARYLLGSIYWKQGRIEDAVKMWRAMDVEDGDSYAKPGRQLFLVVAGDKLQPEDVEEISRILDTERRRWSQFWYQRLKQFGYAFDIF